MGGPFRMRMADILDKGAVYNGVDRAARDATLEAARTAPRFVIDGGRENNGAVVKDYAVTC